MFLRRHRPERRQRQQEPAATPKKSDNDNDNDNDNDDALLDEAEQRAIVDELAAQVAVHHRQVRMIWRVVCYLAAVLCLAVPALLMVVVMAARDDDHVDDKKSYEPSFRSMLWLHATLAALLHGFTPYAMVVGTTTIEAATTTNVTTTMTTEPRRRQRPLLLSGRSRLYATGLILSLFLAALCIANIRYKSTTTTTTTTSNNNTVFLTTNMTIILVRLHQAMAASNLFLTIVALYLANDMEREITALQNLHHSQYRFKSL
jgi:hypothetical protein